MKMKQLLAMLIKAESVLTHGDLLCKVTAASILRGCIATLEADIAKPVEFSFESSVSGLRYSIPGAAGEIAAIHVDGHRYKLAPQEPAAAVIPEGYQPVPIEPTDAMLSAFNTSINTWLKEVGDDADVYKAILAAAPESKT
jgi:hypothetical protein